MPAWQAEISDGGPSGCRYMMAWGRKCGEWDDSVDMANLAMFDFGEIPDDGFVMTTWHENELLQETFWFCDQCAAHASLALERTYIVHIAPEARASEPLETSRAARDGSG